MSGAITLQALAHLPQCRIRGMVARLRRSSVAPDAGGRDDPHCRIFDYNSALLPNPVLAESDRNSGDMESAIRHTGRTVGYPAWNLLYYSVLCSLPPSRKEFVVVETGTNLGFSTIVLAQALKDVGARSRVLTVDLDPAAVAVARENVERAGLSGYVEFHVQDSLEYLSLLVRQVPYIDLAFLDANHNYAHVKAEFSIVFPRVVAGKGKVYFDNTSSGGVGRALQFIRRAYGGSMLEFRNCSWGPPGNAIWQPD